MKKIILFSVLLLTQNIFGQADILTFDCPEQTAPAVINATTGVVIMEVVSGTNITNLATNFTLSNGASAESYGSSMISGSGWDYYTGNIWTVTSADGNTTKTWIFDITEDGTDNFYGNILSFSFAEQTGPATIDFFTREIDVEVEYGTDLTSLVPIFTISTGANSNPSTGIAQDFSSVFTYTITSESGTYIPWNVNVTVGAEDSNVNINDLSSTNDFTIYPNPSFSTIKITFDKIIPEEILVSDIYGNIIMTISKDKINKNEFNLDLNGVSDGVYLVILKTEDDISTRKIIIQK